jgi:hypothetical protein
MPYIVMAMTSKLCLQGPAVLSLPLLLLENCLFSQGIPKHPGSYITPNDSLGNKIQLEQKHGCHICSFTEKKIFTWVLWTSADAAWPWTATHLASMTFHHCPTDFISSWHGVGCQCHIQPTSLISVSHKPG